MSRVGRPQGYSAGNFLSDVDREFAFLSELGFTKESTHLVWRRWGTDSSDLEELPISDAAPLVRFRSGEVEVSVGHDPRAEIQVLVRRPDRPPHSLDVEQIARKAGVADPGQYSGIYASSTTTPAEVLRRLASALREFGRDWLETGSAPGS